MRRNGAGGIQVLNGRMDITNSIIDGNGDDSTAFGGIDLVSPKAGSRLAFNTIADNVAMTSGIGGIRCSPQAAIPTFHSNIVLANTGASQVNGQPGCTYEYSLIVPELTGTGNISGDPAFVGDYRLGEGSAAIGAANPDTASLVPDDADGQPRPNDAPDIGADEYYP